MKAKIKLILFQFFLKISGKYKHLKKTVKCNYAWYGNAYGGFYACPDFLNEQSVIYSFGIGEDISFDTAIIENHNCQVFGFDPTPKSIHWIKNQNIPEKFNFHPFGVSSISGFVDFFLPINTDHVSGSLIDQKNVDSAQKVSVQMKSIGDTMNDLNHTHIDLLKMDIEGSEYDVIENILTSNVSITQILIEFHDRFFENGHLKTKQTIKKLNTYGYEIYAVSDSFEEISFINKNVL